MKKYDLKRAVVTLTETGKLKGHLTDLRHINIYKEEIAKLPQPIDRKTNKSYLEYQREIQRCRARIQSMREQRYFFEVYVKQYRETVTVEWNFQHVELGPKYRKEFQTMLKKVTEQAITRARVHLKAEPLAERWFKGYATQFLGNKNEKARVFFKAGEVLRIYCEKNLNSLYEDKKPVEQRKYIGIELEFCAPIKENIFAIKLFRSGVHKFAQLKKDGSLRPQDGETGYELAILLEESNYKKRLKQLTSLLNEVKAVAIDRRAGLHVHLDMRRRNKDLVYNNLVACQYALLSVVNPSRVDNEFCRIVNSREFPTEFTGNREERYKTINAAAFYKYKTLEVRMHEGSVDYTQISHWVDLLIRIANYSKKLKDDVTKITTLKKRVVLDQKLYNYMQDRSCHWQLNNNTGGLNIAERLRRLADLELRREQIRAQEQAIAGDRIIPVVPPPPDRRNAFQRAADDYNAVGRDMDMRNDAERGRPENAVHMVAPDALMGLEQVREMLHRERNQDLTEMMPAATIDEAAFRITYHPGELAMPDEPDVPEELNAEPEDYDFEDNDEVPF